MPNVRHRTCFFYVFLFTDLLTAYYYLDDLPSVTTRKNAHATLFLRTMFQGTLTV
jgi:hypothetical protein